MLWAGEKNKYLNMKQYIYPHTIEKCGGEKLGFVRLVKDEAGDWLLVETCFR